MWDVVLDALLDTLKLFPFLLLLYILIELMEHNTRVGRANAALSGKWAPLIGGATGLIPMCGFSVMAAKLYEKRYVTLGTLLAVFIATSDEAFLVMLVSDMSWLNKLVSILSMCGIKLLLGALVGYCVDLINRRRRSVLPMSALEHEEGYHVCGHEHEDDHGHGHSEEVSEEHNHSHGSANEIAEAHERTLVAEEIADVHCHGDDHGDNHCENAHEEHEHDHDAHDHDHGHEHGHAHEHDEFTACEHKHGKWGTLSLYFVSPLLHALQVAAFVLLVNLVFGFLFFFIGEENVIGFLQGSGYWFQPLFCSALGFVPNCAATVILAEVYAVGGISFGSCLAGLVVNAGLGYLILFKNVKAWKRTLFICLFLIALGIAVGYAVNAIALLLPPVSL